MPRPPDERTALLAGPPSGRDGPGGGHDGADPEPSSSRAAADEESTAADQQQQQQPLVDEEEWSTARLAVTLGAAYLGSLLAAMDSTILATLSAPISDSFHSFTLFSWLVSAYLIANAGFQPISGKISDIFGRRACLVVANVLFGVGTLICGLAQEEWVIILGRVIAGIGGGCINAISTFVASDLVPLRRRGLWQGIGNICYGFGLGLGGVYGGWIASVLDWRWAFLIQVPFIALSTLIVVFTMKIPVKETNKSKIARVDFPGALTLVCALVLLLLGLNSGGNVVPWGHPLVYVSLPLSAALLALFVYIEDRVAAEPIIPVRLLVKRTVASACFVNWTISMAYFIYLFYGPIYFRIRGFADSEVGVPLVFNAAGVAGGSLGAGLVIRATGRYYYLSMGTQATFVLACALMFGLFDLGTPKWTASLLFFLGGIGYGAMLTVTLLALISTVAHKFQAVITSASYAARSTGSSLGIGIASAVFQNVLTTRLWEELGGEEDAAALIKSLRDSIGAVGELEPALRASALAAYMDALRHVFGVTLLLSVLGASVSLLMRENTLYNNLARK